MDRTRRLKKPTDVCRACLSTIHHFCPQRPTASRSENGRPVVTSGMSKSPGAMTVYAGWRQVLTVLWTREELDWGICEWQWEFYDVHVVTTREELDWAICEWQWEFYDVHVVTTREELAGAICDWQWVLWRAYHNTWRVTVGHLWLTVRVLWRALDHRYFLCHVCYERSIMTEANSSFVATLTIMNCVTRCHWPQLRTRKKERKQKERKKGKESFRQNKERPVCVCVRACGGRGWGGGLQMRDSYFMGDRVHIKQILYNDTDTFPDPRHSMKNCLEQ